MPSKAFRSTGIPCSTWRLAALTRAPSDPSRCWTRRTSPASGRGARAGASRAGPPSPPASARTRRGRRPAHGAWPHATSAGGSGATSTIAETGSRSAALSTSSPPRPCPTATVEGPSRSKRRDHVLGVRLEREHLGVGGLRPEVVLEIERRGPPAARGEVAQPALPHQEPASSPWTSSRGLRRDRRSGSHDST